MKFMFISSIIALVAAFACTSQAGSTADNQGPTADTVSADRPTFDADSAFAYVKAQTDFGPRVAGSEGNRQCREWIAAKLRQFGADTVEMQAADLSAFNGDKFKAVNIFARFNKSATKRILLLAHYDTRPWADEDPDPANHTKPIPGANDGGSGVAVMLEVARQLSITPVEIGVDMLFVDAEDYGDSHSGDESSWALGTQYWVNHMPYDKNELPAFGILLDIVGGVNAKFYREYHSELYARAINTKVWTAARSCGFGQQFVNSQAGAVTDDHIHINRAGIPCIDIIECNNPSTGSFPPTWHTLADDINSIDRQSLLSVGSTVMQVIRNEK
ncbi:MAG: M28 family peptidase [Muribaculaceae bacterium]|nr:M28 family peptidase [Muribaculaceae bacterium]